MVSDDLFIEQFISYLNKSWTHFHATDEARILLETAGFQRLSEREEWKLEPNGKYFFTRNMSTIVAFALGGKFKAGNGFNIIAAHTDSPCPKLKPISNSTKGGFLKVGVSTYGGGLWHTWFDRDLSVAGKVVIREGDTIKRELVRIDRPIMRIPTLAIHLDRNVSTEGFKPNAETHLAPLLATSIKAALKTEAEAENKTAPKPAHHPLLSKLLADALKCKAEDILDFELNVCDTQPSVVGGAENEFIFSGRLDNLCMSFTALKALISACEEPETLANESGAWLCALFDHEEVGSDSAQGAGSPVMVDAMRRATLCQGEGGEGLVERMLRRSFVVSADMAHSLHPNYMEKHEENHQPNMHKGLVIKHNANQRYATTAVTSILFREVALRAGVPVQSFCVRNDAGCGSTIGPILASGIGIRCLDVGVPQLSMHSVREMCGTDDVVIAYKHFAAFYKTFTEVDATIVLPDE
mmetsp:Transcript_39745/g.55187  ORF Transcript_39745/g.55187 Transcript_39745/m.55187 type:complete len:468 (+) Transcript_39745:63-1466(+)